MVVFRSQAQRACTRTLKMSYSDVDLTLNHLFHGYITDVSCHFHVRWWRFESQSFSWAHYRWAMSDVGDLNLITDFMGTLHISHVRCWWFESQSVIQWVLCRWALSDADDLNLSHWFSGYFADEPCQMMVTWISVSDSVGTLQMNQVLTVLSRCLTEPQKKQLLSVLGQELQGSRYTWLMSCINSFWQLSSQENKHWSWV